MYRRILISTDGSEVAQRGVDHGLSLAKQLGLPVTILTVSERFPVYSGGIGYDFSWSSTALDEYAEGKNAAAEAILRDASLTAEGLGVAAETVHLPDAQIAEAIIACAGERGCGLIVMASHGRRGIERIMLGSNTAEVLAHSNIPVLVVR